MLIKISADEINKICECYDSDPIKKNDDEYIDFFDYLDQMAKYVMYSQYPYVSLNEEEYKKIRRYVYANR